MFNLFSFTSVFTTQCTIKGLMTISKLLQYSWSFEILISNLPNNCLNYLPIIPKLCLPLYQSMNVFLVKCVTSCLAKSWLIGRFVVWNIESGHIYRSWIDFFPCISANVINRKSLKLNSRINTCMFQLVFKNNIFYIEREVVIFL